MTLEYATQAPTAPRTGIRFLFVTVGGGVGLFIMWCALDAMSVYLAPTQSDHFDKAFLILPILMGMVAAAVLKHLIMIHRIALSILATLCAVMIATVLVAVIGVAFHLSIGGQL